MNCAANSAGDLATSGPLSPAISTAERSLNSLREVLEATSRHTPTQFSWFGAVSDDVQEHIRPILALRPDAARANLTGTLAYRLYESFYQLGRCRPTPVPYGASPWTYGWEAFVEDLRTANTGSGTWQAGWLVVDVRSKDGVQVLAIRRGELTLLARPEEISYRHDGLPVAGDEVELRLPKDLPAISPGFYTVLGDEPYDARGRQVVRVYWNLYPWGATSLVRGITMRLNASGLPFRLKLVDHPDRYNRCDAAVLYLFKRDLNAAAPLLALCHADVQGDLKEPVPALTRRISSGVGLAEDPADGDSFGMHRCRLLAEGIVRGWERGAEAVEDRLAVVIEVFAEAGINPERPYLNPDSEDDYEFSFHDTPRTAPAVHRVEAGAPATPQLRATAYLQVASEIGQEICKEAFWYDRRCNWLGVEPSGPVATAYQAVNYGSLGPDAYGGSSGVALYLAELAIATGDDSAHKTALGAIRQALGRAEAIEPPLHLGLFTGWPGIALAATLVGRLLDAGRVTSAARALLDGIDIGLESEHEHDLLCGSAGGIVALLRLGELLGDRSLIDRAARLGESLIASAQCDESGCSWTSPAFPNITNLTGLSHGAAGIGVALLELWDATGVERYRDVAEQAFSFEQSWFDEKERNWPDFRNAIVRDGQPAPPFHFKTHWCHGAPGIALSRLRAWQLTGESHYQRQAIVALETTEGAVQQALRDGTANYSLCHGLAGNAEILLRGYRALGSELERFRATAFQVAGEGMRLYAAPERAWPCGTHGGWTPGLMLGTAGIGRFYLYAADPSLPCMLLHGLS